MGLFGGPGQPVALSSSRPHDSHRRAVPWDAFVEALFAPDEGGTPGEVSGRGGGAGSGRTSGGVGGVGGACNCSRCSDSESRGLPLPRDGKHSIYFAIQPGADQNDGQPYEFPLSVPVSKNCVLWSSA